jgi:hypothetical protein
MATTTTASGAVYTAQTYELLKDKLELIIAKIDAIQEHEATAPARQQLRADIQAIVPRIATLSQGA